MKLITPVICELCEFDWKNGACGNCQMSRAQLDAVSALQQRVRELEVILQSPTNPDDCPISCDECVNNILEVLRERAISAEAKLSSYEQGLEITVDVCQGQHGNSFIFLPDQFAGQRVTVIVLGESRRYTLTPKERDNKAINTSVSDTGTTMLPLVGCVDSQMIST